MELVLSPERKYRYGFARYTCDFSMISERQHIHQHRIGFLIWKIVVINKLFLQRWIFINGEIILSEVTWSAFCVTRQIICNVCLNPYLPLLGLMFCNYDRSSLLYYFHNLFICLIVTVISYIGNLNSSVFIYISLFHKKLDLKINTHTWC